MIHQALEYETLHNEQVLIVLKLQNTEPYTCALQRTFMKLWTTVTQRYTLIRISKANKVKNEKYVSFQTAIKLKQ